MSASPAKDPEQPDHLIDHIKTAAAARTPLRITGGDTKAFYGEAVAGQPLSTRDWTGIVSHEPTELVITVRAGTPLADVEAALAEAGQCLPFDPPRFGPDAGAASTIGGVVAAGLAGPARATVGGVRDFVLGAQFIDGRGEWLSFGGQVMKNVAGYDVSRALAGSMGTLGVITHLSLKVLPVAPAEATLVFRLDQHEALAQLHRWGGRPLPLNASCWVRDDTAADRPDLLFVRLRGAVAAVESACEVMLRDAAGGERMDNAQAGPDWAACRDQALPFFLQPPSPDLCLWRLSLPQTAPVIELPQPQLVEWQGAQRWLWAPASAAAQIRAAAVGGHATLFRAGADGAPGVPRFDAQSPAIRAITRRLREAFDPQGIFNPGRMG